MHLSTRFLFLAASLALLSVSAPRRAHAQLWQSAQVLSAKSFSLGAYGSFVFAPSADFMGFAQAKVGLGNNLDLEARFGGGSLSPYFGGFLKWQFLSTEVVNLAVWGGYHYQGTSQVDASVVVSHSFSRFEIYGAPFFQMAFDSTGVRAGGGFIPGFSFSLARQARLYVEFVLGSTPVLNSGSIGVKFYL